MPKQGPILLARYHDGLAKTNWGGRATSLALLGELADCSSASDISVMNGSFITSDIGDFPFRYKLVQRGRHFTSRVRGSGSGTIFRPYDELEVHAAKFLASSADTPRSVVEMIASCEEFVMNGEGDFIAKQSGTLWRTLLLMTVARMLGKRVILLNSILSEASPSEATDRSAIEAIGRVLGSCDEVIFRDPQSLRNCNSWFPQISDAAWMPDALFRWASYEVTESAATYSWDWERLSVEAGQLIQGNVPFATITGSSSLCSSIASHSSMVAIAERLRALGLAAVFVATAQEDEWLASCARETGSAFVPSNVPLATARLLLSESRALIGGRYHPAILAATVGTPVVLFESNSHKTTSLIDVLAGNGVAAKFGSTSLVDAVDIVVSDAARPEATKKAAVDCRSRVSKGISRLWDV